MVHCTLYGTTGHHRAWYTTHPLPHPGSVTRLHWHFRVFRRPLACGKPCPGPPSRGSNSPFLAENTPYFGSPRVHLDLQDELSGEPPPWPGTRGKTPPDPPRPRADFGPEKVEKARFSDILGQNPHIYRPGQTAILAWRSRSLSRAGRPGLRSKNHEK